MSSYHVLTTSGQGIKYSLLVEYHIPVPDETFPLTSSNLRALLAADTEISKTSDIASASEITQAQNGEVLFRKEDIRIHEGQSNVEIRGQIRARYDELSVSAIDRLKARYRAYGFSETKGVDF